ncbi:uncharacterized protein PAE49_005180 isoform 1-T2 [Odontesthes bonariensis]|uniref:uncharacterized protein LOC142379833 n=1 Tax=Odontesthes bonariensis TaxID=219752 RepID=UPI003F58DCF9
MELNDSCRFCKKNMRISGVLVNSAHIFERQKEKQTIAERLTQVGVPVLQTQAKSNRICKVCQRFFTRIEHDLPVLRRWVQDENEEASTSASAQKRHREPTPAKTPRALTKFCNNPASPRRMAAVPRLNITQVISDQELHKAEDALLVKHIMNKKWKAAAKLIMKHEELSQEVKVSILTVIESESRTLCDPSKKCMLWRSSPEDLSSFSFSSLESDLQRLSPLLLSFFTTITKHSRFVTCAAAAIALRGREDRLSGFAYYINCILQYGGAKKAVFERLSKFAISTTYNSALGKRKELAKCGSGLWSLKRQNEEFLAMEAGCQSVSQEQDETSIDTRRESEMLLSGVFRSTEDLQLSELAESCATDQATPEEEVTITSEVAETEQATSDEEECHVNANCQVSPIIRHVASQTDPPDFDFPKTRSVGTQLSMKTLQNPFRSTGTQVKVTSRDRGMCTVTLPLNSPMLFLQPTLVKRPSKRPRLNLTEDEEEGPSE